MRASGITLTCPDTGPVAGGSWMGSGTGWSREPAEWRRMTEYGIRNMGITSVWSVCPAMHFERNLGCVIQAILAKRQTTWLLQIAKNTMG